MISDEEMAYSLAILGTAVNKEITKEILKVYAAALGDLEPEELRSGIEWLVAEHKYATLPTPGEIRARSLLVRGAKAPGALEAYGIASKCARVWGSHPDNLSKGFQRLPTSIKRAIEAIGGWNAFCESDNPEAMRAHFAKAYDPMILESERMKALPPALQQRIRSIREKNRAIEEQDRIKRLGDQFGTERKGET